MANELSLAISATHTKNGVVLSKTFTKTVTVTGNQPISAVQVIGTSDEALTAGDAGSGGYLICKNLSATDFLEIGHTSGTYSVMLRAGEIAGLRAGSGMTTIHCRANTNACNLEYLLLPD